VRSSPPSNRHAAELTLLSVVSAEAATLCFARLTSSNQWEWHGPCKADIQGAFLDHLKADLSVENISECDLVTPHILANFEKQPAALELQQELSAAQADGTTDAMILVTRPEYKEFLGVNIGLRAQKYEVLRTFLTLHFGRTDLIGRISYSFSGFAAEPSKGGLRIPSESEFLNGRPYFVLDDSSLVFSANPLS
jgi:hypothetical protein